MTQIGHMKAPREESSLPARRRGPVAISGRSCCNPGRDVRRGPSVSAPARGQEHRGGSRCSRTWRPRWSTHSCPSSSSLIGAGSASPGVDGRDRRERERCGGEMVLRTMERRTRAKTLCPGSATCSRRSCDRCSPWRRAPGIVVAIRTTDRIGKRDPLGPARRPRGALGSVRAARATRSASTT